MNVKLKQALGRETVVKLIVVCKEIDLEEDLRLSTS